MRKIIHIDADSFYASVEIRENPSLASQPVAVGGSPSGRGVIATCNYIARGYGVHSAIPSSHALRLCPQLVFIKPNFELYRSVSTQIHEIFKHYTETIEPLSLDEAYLDVSNSNRCQGSATLMAEEIRQRVRNQVKVTVSAGVAPNKFLAKVASDWNKPDGITVIKPAEVADFVKSLPVNKINGVGKVTAAKMQQLGITNCEDLQKLDIVALSKHFGVWGAKLFDLAQGIDNRPVSTNRIRKSLSTEHTYGQDLADLPDIIAKCESIFKELQLRFQKIDNRYRVTKRYVKIKFNNFQQTTLEETLPPSEPWARFENYKTLIEAAWQRKAKPVRLLGMGVRLKELSGQEPGAQLELFQ